MDEAAHNKSQTGDDEVFDAAETTTSTPTKHVRFKERVEDWTDEDLLAEVENTSDGAKRPYNMKAMFSSEPYEDLPDNIRAQILREVNEECVGNFPQFSVILSI